MTVRVAAFEPLGPVKAARGSLRLPTPYFAVMASISARNAAMLSAMNRQPPNSETVDPAVTETVGRRIRFRYTEEHATGMPRTASARRRLLSVIRMAH